jgi:hypothetical protein
MLLYKVSRIQTRSSDVSNSSKSKIFRIFKVDFGFEKYVVKLLKKLRTNFLKVLYIDHISYLVNGWWDFYKHGIILKCL